MRGLDTVPQGNREPLVVTVKVGRPQVSFGEQVRETWYFLTSVLWHQRADERLGTVPQGNREPLVVTVKVGRPQVSFGEQVRETWYFLTSVLWHWFGDGKANWPVNSWVLLCWWWRFACTLDRPIVPAVTIISTILASIKSKETFWYRLTRVVLENGR